MLNYGMPMVVVGIGGMVNETFDRVMLGHLLPLPAFEAAIQVAIYGANYKIAIFITLFITAFRFSAEPFFFREAQNKQAPATYARVMKWFVIVLCFAFLFTALYLDIWKYYIGSTYRSGLGVVPILLAANVCLGIYYNLSVWYKVSDKMQYGMYITLLGAVLTLVSNYIYIPQYGMYACAYTTLVAYGVMMIAGYVLGQKFYPIPYPVGRIVGYLALIAALYFINRYVGLQISNRWLRLGIGTLCMSVFLGVVAYWEKNELQGMIKRR